jgi:hypothetical protein
MVKFFGLLCQPRIHGWGFVAASSHIEIVYSVGEWADREFMECKDLLPLSCVLGNC